jgi:hypothetical protein
MLHTETVRVTGPDGSAWSAAGEEQPAIATALAAAIAASADG